MSIDTHSDSAPPSAGTPVRRRLNRPAWGATTVWRVEPTAPPGKRLSRRPRAVPTACLLAADLVAFGGAVALTGATGLRTVLVLLLVLVFFANADLYRSRLSFSLLDDAPALLGRALAAGAGAMVVGGVKNGVVGTERLQTAVVFAGFCLVGRAVVYHGIRVARRRHRLQRRTLLVGAGTVAGALAANLLLHPEYGLDPEGMLDDDPLLTESERPVPVLGGCADLSRVIVQHAVDAVVVTYGSLREPSMVDLLRACGRLSCEIYYVPRLYELHTVTKYTEVLWGLPLLRLRRAPFRAGTWTAKRIWDIAVSGFALLFLLPVLALCAALAWWETGRVLFHQARIGLDGRPFTLLKFCSMPPANNEESSTLWNIGDDDRLGPIGRLLRRTSLDELPQLWNVLRGDMSLVGPRPERPHFVDDFTQQFPWYPARHRVPAGLTGWAQVHGLRGDTSIADRARFDNFYIENWSMWGDMKIMLRTAAQVVRAGGR